MLAIINDDKVLRNKKEIEKILTEGLKKIHTYENPQNFYTTNEVIYKDSRVLVYKGTQLKSGLSKVCKHIRMKAENKEDEELKLLRECQLLYLFRSCDHIVSIEEVFSYKNELYVFLEYMDGENIHHFIK